MSKKSIIFLSVMAGIAVVYFYIVTAVSAKKESDAIMNNFKTVDESLQLSTDSLHYRYKDKIDSLNHILDSIKKAE